MNKKIKTDAVDELFEAILHLKTVEECYAFFEDVCTVNELLSFSQRYEVARMLRESAGFVCYEFFLPVSFLSVSFAARFFAAAASFSFSRRSSTIVSIICFFR